jgi:carbamoylphosphate synthase small subunit
MPTVLRLDGLRVVIYPNDHRPAHVHVIGPEGEAVFVLNCPGGPVSLRESVGFIGRVLRAVEAALNDVLPGLCGAWETIHGAE